MVRRANKKSTMLFDSAYYTEKCTALLDGNYSVRLLASGKARAAFAAATVKWVKKEIDERPHQKPDYQLIRGQLLSDPDLKGFFPLVITVLIQFALWQLLEWIWNNWTNAEPR